ncbi:hypothetical protein MCHI_002042 [Candidatus Magnetoovum chiemensis]|nr:hypothetical protein MCHI_002042 [Candidatus Magnetoovum chiemensis]
MRIFNYYIHILKEAVIMGSMRIEVSAGQKYLPYAKKELKAMKEFMKGLGLNIYSKYLKLEGFTIYLESVNDNDRIRISGAETHPIYIYLIYVKHVSDAWAEYEVGGYADEQHRVLPYKLNLNKNAYELIPVDKEIKNLTIESKGLNLAVQPGKGDINHYAVLSHNIVHKDFIDGFREDGNGFPYANFNWGNNERVFNVLRHIGSDKAYLPKRKTWEGASLDAAMEYSGNSRVNYTLDDDRNLLHLDYKITPKLIGAGLCFEGEWPTYRLLNDWQIQYRDKPEGEWKHGTHLGTDYETPRSNHAYKIDGYKWGYIVPTMIIDPIKAVYRTVDKELRSSPYIKRKGKEYLNYNYYDYTLYTTSTVSQDHTLEDFVQKEKLYFGDTILEDTELIRTTSVLEGLVYYNEYNAAVGLRGTYDRKERGDSEIGVMALANYKSDNSWIIFYRKTTDDSSDTGKNATGSKEADAVYGMEGAYAVLRRGSFKRIYKYYMAYRVNGGDVIKEKIGEYSSSYQSRCLSSLGLLWGW